MATIALRHAQLSTLNEQLAQFVVAKKCSSPEKKYKWKQYRKLMSLGDKSPCDLRPECTLARAFHYEKISQIKSNAFFVYFPSRRILVVSFWSSCCAALANVSPERRTQDVLGECWKIMLSLSESADAKMHSHFQRKILDFYEPVVATIRSTFNCRGCNLCDKQKSKCG